MDENFPRFQCSPKEPTERRIKVGKRRTKTSSLYGNVGVESRSSLSQTEVEERSNLFQVEFNKADIHDRVLVVQVMPDDYELQELQVSLLKLKCNQNETSDDLQDEDRHSQSSDKQYVCIQSAYRVEVEKEERAVREINDECEKSCSTDRGTDLGVHIETKSGSETIGISEKFENDDVMFPENDDTFCVSLNENISVELNECKETEPAAVEISPSFHCSGQVVESECLDNCDNESVGAESRDMIGAESRDMDRNENTYCFTAEIISPIESGVEESFGSMMSSDEEIDECETRGDKWCHGVHVIRERRLYVHSCYLAVNSQYFRSMLFGSGMKECSTKEVQMKVSESDEYAFMMLIESIYDLDVLDQVTMETLLNVIRLAVKYDVTFSLKKAKRVLSVKPLTLELCEVIIAGVAKGGFPDLDDVMEKVERLLVQEFEPLEETWESEKFVGLSRGALEKLLGSNLLVVQSENNVFVALMRWITTRSEVYNDLSELSQLLHLIRFSLMNVCYLHDVVKVHEVATRLDNFDEIYLAAITKHALPKKRRPRENPRQWCDAKTPTYMWFVDADEELFVFKDNSINTKTSSSFWFLGYKMHLILDVSEAKEDTNLSLVVENLSEDGSVKLACNVDVKFSEHLHKSYTTDVCEYRKNEPGAGMYPFHEKYSVEEIKENVFGGLYNLTIIFEISLEKLKDD